MTDGVLVGISRILQELEDVFALLLRFLLLSGEHQHQAGLNKRLRETYSLFALE